MRQEYIKYIIKPKDKKVIGIYENHVLEWMRDEFRKSLTNSEYDWLHYGIGYPHKIPINIKAMATCDEKDSWDEQTGKNVVNAKIDMKQHRSVAKNMRYFVNILKGITGKIEELIEYHEKKAAAIENDLKRYYCDGEVD